MQESPKITILSNASRLSLQSSYWFWWLWVFLAFWLASYSGLLMLDWKGISSHGLLSLLLLLSACLYCSISEVSREEDWRNSLLHKITGSKWKWLRIRDDYCYFYFNNLYIYVLCCFYLNILFYFYVYFMGMTNISVTKVASNFGAYFTIFFRDLLNILGYIGIFIKNMGFLCFMNGWGCLKN